MKTLDIQDAIPSPDQSLAIPWQGRSFLLLLFLAIAILLCIADRAPMHLKSRFADVRIEQEFYFYYDGVINHTLPGPYVYRVLAPFTIFLLHKLFSFTDPITIDFILKALILSACQYIFFRYLRFFFGAMPSLAGVLWFDMLTGFSLSSLQGPTVIETGDIVNVMITTLTLDAIFRNRFRQACVAMVIGLLNRETVLLLPVVMVLADRSAGRGYARSAAAAIVLIICYIGIHMFVTTSNFDWVTTGGIALNVPWLSEQHTLHAIAGNLHVLVLLGPLAALSIYRFNSHPLHLRLAAAVVPVFVTVHYLFGTIIEARLWMPLFIILIPLALANIVHFFEFRSVK